MAKQLSDEKLKEYKEKLTQEKEQAQKIINSILKNQSAGSKDSAGDLSSYSIHQADQGTDTDQRETETYLLTKQQQKVKMLNLGLKRIYEKTYGICQICGSDIPEGRLKIVPYAKYCIKCKEEEEKKKRK